MHTFYGNIWTDDHDRFLCLCDVLQEALLECDLVIDDIAVKRCVLLIGGNAVTDVCITLKTLTIHFLKHDGMIVDIIIDADFPLAVMETMQTSDILRQRSLP